MSTRRRISARLQRVTLFVAALVWCAGQAATALACGGGFGKVDLGEHQAIAVGFRDGVETYVFAPEFCGAPEAFGLIVPIAGALQDDPAVAPTRLFSQLEALSAPSIERVRKCKSNVKSRGVAAGSKGGDDNIQVVSQGTVDIFDWVELSANDTSALTDWLDDNEFEYDSSAMAAFDEYIERDFRFVAFKVSPKRADESQEQLCGTFGPIALHIETTKPVVPLRIVVAHSDSSWQRYTWDVFVASEQQMRAESSKLDTELRFSGELDAKMLTTYSAVSSLATKGDRLTWLRVTFDADVADDLWLVPNAKPTDFRATTQLPDYVDCDGCSVAGGEASHGGDWLPALVVIAVLRMRRRRI